MSTKDVVISILVTILIADVLQICRVELVCEDARLLNVTIAANGGTDTALLALVIDIVRACITCDSVRTWSLSTSVARAAVVVISDGRSANQLTVGRAANAQIVCPLLGVLTWVLSVALGLV
jgi:hypothetical protein